MSNGVPQPHLDAVIRALSRDTGTVKLERRSQSLVVAPTHGFEITVYEDQGEAMVSAARWHSHFDSPDQTAACVIWLLTPFARVVHEYKGSILAAVWVEQGINGEWEPSDPVYFLNPEYPPEWKLMPGQTYIQRRVWQNSFQPPFVPPQPPPSEPDVTFGTSPMCLDLFD